MSSPDSHASKARSQQPELPDFWCKRFSDGQTPWEANGLPAQFLRFVTARADRPSTLIPGCGRAWEAAFLANRGWPVAALDFSPEAIRQARSVVGRAPVTLLCEDFFNFTPRINVTLIYEHAFLCALPPSLRSAWARRLVELLPPGGILAGYFFITDNLRGPPFGTSRGTLTDLLGEHFECLEDSPSSDAIPLFSGHEYWQVWRHR